MNIIKKIKNHLYKLLVFIYPNTCYICKETVTSKGLCYQCFSKLETVPVNSCKKCGFFSIEEIDNNQCKCYLNNNYFGSLISCFVYNETIYKLISYFKYQDHPEIASYIANIMINNFKNKIGNTTIDIVTCVPISYKKLLYRQYNHMSLVAKLIAKDLNTDFKADIIKKIKNTKPQMSLNLSERASNLKGSMIINSKCCIKNKNILLIDDIVTTGSTINECSKVLKAAGARKVIVLSTSRVEGSLKT